MQNRLTKAMASALLCCLGAAAAAQTTTVAGITPGQFAVSESGAATYRIPIQVPPGVAGMEPKLELSYNSQGGNGLLGVGWSLSGLSAITRCPRTMAQDGVRGGVNFDLNDRYCMDGQRLVLVSGTYGTANSEYRTELDSFSRIIASGTAGNGVASFTVQTKAGLTMEYGNTADSRIEAQGKTSVRVWAINRISDVKTNFMTFSYVEDNANGDFYPSRIDYSGNVVSGSVPVNSVRFAYEDRGDVDTAYFAGVPVKRVSRLAQMQIYADSVLQRSYQLRFASSTTPATSQLSSVQECVVSTICRQPIQFTYRLSGDEAISTGQQVLTTTSLGSNLYSAQAADLNGDGKADLIATYQGASGWIVWTSLGRGDGTFEPAVQRTLTASSLGTDLYRTQVADINGDGRPDLIATYQGPDGWIVWTALGKGDGSFEPGSQRVLTATSLGSNLYSSQVVDLNGDGKSDLLATYQGPSGWVTWSAIGRGDGTFEPASQQVLTTTSLGSNLYSAQAADLNGDGKADLIATYQGASGWIVWTSLGRGDGTFEPAVQRTLTASSLGTDLYRTQVADINGDGRPDLIATYQGPDGWIVWTALGKGDGSFEPGSQRVLTATSLGSNLYSSQVVDLNGDGKSDLLATYQGPSGWVTWSAIGRGDGTFEPASQQVLTTTSLGSNLYSAQAADLNGDGKADLIATYQGSSGWVAWTSAYADLSNQPPLLSTVSPGLDAATKVLFAPLTNMATYTKDSTPTAAIYPKLDLIYPQYVVSAVTSSNGVGGTVTTQYSYGGLKAELGTGRGMLGFRWMKSKNLANGIESYTEFNQGWPFTGSVAKAETRLTGSGSAGVLKRTTNTYAQSTGSGGTATFVYPSQSVEESWDLNGTAYPTVTNAYVYGQSPQYGDPTQITVSNSGGSSKTTANEYWPASTGSGSWVLGRLKKASVTSVKP